MDQDTGEEFVVDSEMERKMSHKDGYLFESIYGLICCFLKD